MKTFDLFGHDTRKPRVGETVLLPTPTKADGERSSLTYCRGNPTLLGGATSNPSTYLSEDSPARIFRWQERARALTEPGAVFGGSSTDLSVKYDPATQSWRTSLRSLFGGFLLYLERFPRSGMMRNGRLYQRPRLVPRTLEKDSSLWPTPRTRDSAEAGTGNGVLNEKGRVVRASGHDYGLALCSAVKMWPTPHATCSTGAGSQGRSGGLKIQTAVKEKEMFPTPNTVDAKGGNRRGPGQAQLCHQVAPEPGKQLSADWVSLLMGFPPGWTDLSPGATDGKTASPEPSGGSPTASTD